MPSEADLEKSFYAANLGISENEMSRKSLSELHAGFLALTLIKAPNPKTTVLAAPAAATLYTQANLQSIADSVNAIRTALLNAGLIQ